MCTFCCLYIPNQKLANSYSKTSPSVCISLTTAISSNTWHELCVAAPSPKSRQGCGALMTSFGLECLAVP